MTVSQKSRKWENSYTPSPFRLATIPAGFSSAKTQVQTPKISSDQAKNRFGETEN
jgi:hypothetical protein